MTDTISTPDLCDAYPERVRVLEPMLANFGGIDAFGGPVVTVKCFEDNSVVKELAAAPGEGRVMVVDGGGAPGINGRSGCGAGGRERLGRCGDLRLRA